MMDRLQGKGRAVLSADLLQTAFSYRMSASA